MPKYFAGLNEALSKVDIMNEQQCLDYIDDLYGRENLKYGDSLENVKNELRRQIREDFTDRSPEAMREDEWIKAMAEACKR
jgi:hypothetical protein